MEFVGGVLGEVRYTSSQPWPFPSTLMLGCRAEVRAALDGTSEELAVPPPLAIAHHLMRDWVEEAK